MARITSVFLRLTLTVSIVTILTDHRGACRPQPSQSSSAVPVGVAREAMVLALARVPLSLTESPTSPFAVSDADSDADGVPDAGKYCMAVPNPSADSNLGAG